MKSSLTDIPVFESRQTSVPAEVFNIVRIASKRLKVPLHISLPKLRTLELVLDDETWIVVDNNLNDIPVMAWLDFQTKGRALHEAVMCRLNLYHIHADLIHDRVMESMVLILGEMLDEAGLTGDGAVRPLK
jgi:hypothetical protein